MAEARTDREQQAQTKREVSTQQKMLPATRSAFDYPANPFDIMRRLTEQMFGPLAPRSFTREEIWAPQIEVTERDGKLVVTADLPGMKKDDVRVEVLDNNLIIEGERRQERKEDREGYFVTERSYGKFYRAIPLPEGVNPENAKATFRDGVLELTLDAPKKKSSARTIPIEESREKSSR